MVAALQLKQNRTESYKDFGSGAGDFIALALPESSSEITQRTRKRTDGTRLFICRITRHGFASPCGVALLPIWGFTW
jgi:hypothetical protein